MLKNNQDSIVETIIITNPDKKIFYKPKITKKEIALYYQKIAQRMLPYLEHRIISAIRAPEGVNGDIFYKKHLDNSNKGVGKINLPSTNERKEDFYFIKSVEGLISEVQMNTIEFHIWGSKVGKLNKPDMMVFDLDPDENLTLKHVRQGVRDLKSLLDKLGLISFLKTSGGKGYHVVVPLKPSIGWKRFRDFAKNIAILMEEKWPERYVSNVRKINRKNKIFIDWIRNTKTATSVAPYSIRLKKKVTVSMPIAWEELDKIAPDNITISKAIQRLNKKDPWVNFFEVTQQISDK